MEEGSGSSCFVCCEPLVAFPDARVFEADFERCLGCCAVFRRKSAQLSDERVRAFYQTHQNDVFDAGYRRFLSKLVDPLKAILAPGAVGLDFGSGPAPALALLMREAGYDMSAYDPLFASDETLLTRVYEFVTCTEVVEHFREPARDWARLFSLVQPGGVLAVMTEWYRGQSPLSAWRYARDPTHSAFLSQGALSRLGRLYGAEVEFPCDNVSFFRV